MADQKENKGFSLPVPGQGGGEHSGARTGQAGGDGGIPSVQVNLGSGSDTSTRDLAIGIGVMVVLLVAFFFARSAYANWLVGRKVSPRSANAAGWWLFIFLTCLAAAGVFPLAAKATFLSAIFLAPVLVVALAALVMMLLSSRR